MNSILKDHLNKLAKDCGVKDEDLIKDYEKLDPVYDFTKERKKVSAELALKQLISDAIVSGSELQMHEPITPLFNEYYKKLDRILEDL